MSGARHRGLRRERRRLLGGCALAALLAVAAPAGEANAQAFNANPTTTAGTVVYDRTTPGQDIVTVETPTAIVEWLPTVGGNPISFLPGGTTAIFQNGPGINDYVLLNRVLAKDPIRFDGTLIGRLELGSGNFVPGGTLLFASPGGIIIGQNASFDVGNLVLTTLGVTDDGAGNFITADGGFAFVGDEAFATRSVVTEAESQIVATSENSYLAMVAPRVHHGGSADVNGSTAYIAGEQLQFTVNQGLFDIVVDLGSSNSDAIVHSGTTGGPASTGGVDNHRIYMVAVPRNLAITALLSGDVGFDPAINVSVENGAIVLSAGFDVSGDDVAPNSISTTEASFSISNATITSDLTGHATGEMAAGGGVEPLTFEQSVRLFADRQARLFADPGQTVTVLGNARVSASRSPATDPTGHDLMGGNASADAGAGGLLDIAGNLTVDASGTGNSEAGGTGGDGAGGNARIFADGGAIQIGGNANVRADGAGADTTFLAGGDGAGGRASVQSSGGGSVTVTGNLLVSADGTGGSVTDANEAAGSGTGGRVTLATTGGSIDAGGADLSARGTGGELVTPFVALDGAAGTGGLVAISATGGGPLGVAGNVEIDVSGQGGGGALGNVGGNGGGGDLTLSADGAAITFGSTTVEAGGFGGAGGSALPGGVGGTGGEGSGGDVLMSAGPGGTLTIEDLLAEAPGQGGAGAGGGGHDAAAGSGGAGGDGTGGEAELRSDGGAVLVTGKAGTMLTARGLGGDGGGGGEGFGGSASGGDGGAGGDATGGDARIVSAGGSVGAGPATVAAGATAGDGGAGGNGGGTGGAGGAGGTASSGGARLLALGGTLGVGEAVVTVNARGGAGGAGGAGGTSDGAGGDGGDAVAGLDEVAFTRGAYVNAEGGDLDVASAVIQATATGGDGGAGAAGGDGGDGSGGGARFGSTAGTLQAAGLVALAANGLGGAGGAALPSAGTGGEGGKGGAGFGGRILVSAEGSPAAAVDGQEVQLFATGIGGDGGSGAPGAVNGGNGGGGGAGTGGDATILAARGTLTLGDARLGANGFGGAGGDGGDGDPGVGQGGAGGAGATGNGGSVAVSSGSAAATVGDVELVASGTGGTGGLGGAGASPGGAGADAGDFGGLARIDSSLADPGDPAGSLTAGAVTMRVEGDAGGRIDVATRFSPATFDSLDVFGRGIALALASAEDSLLRVDGTASFDVDSDLFLFTVGTGRIEVGGLLQVTAGGSIIADQDIDAVATATTIGAGTFRAIAGADYRGDGSTVTAAGLIDIDAPGQVEAGTLVAGGRIEVDGASIELTAGTAAGDIDLNAPGAINVGTADAGDDFAATAGGVFTADDVSADDGIAIDADSIALTAATAGGVIDLNAPGAVTVGTADAGADFVAVAGGSLTGGDLTADGGIAIDAAGIVLTAATAGGDIDLASPGNIDVGTADAGDDFIADAGGSFTGADVTANVGSDILIDAVGLLRLDNGEASGLIRLTSTGDGVVSDGRLQAGNALRVDAATDVDLSEVAAGTIDLTAGGDLAVDEVDAGDTVLATAGGDIAAPGVQAGQNVVLDAGGNVTAGDIAAGRDLLVSGATVALTDGVAGRDIRLDAAAAITVMSAQAGDDFRAVAGATFTGDRVEATGLGPDSEAGSGPLNGAGNILIEANGEVRLDTADAAARLRLDSFGGGIVSDGSLNAARLVVAAADDVDLTEANATGDIILSSQNGGIAGAGLDSGGSLRLDAAGAVTVADARAGTDLVADAASVDLGNAVAGRDVALTADGAILVGTAQAGDDFGASAGTAFTGDAVTATGLGPDSEAGSGPLSGSGNILIEAGGDLRLADGDAALRLRLRSIGGSLVSDGRLVTDGPLTARSAGGMAIAEASAGGPILIEAGGAAVLGSFDAGGGIDVTAASVAFAEAAAGGDLRIASNGDLRLDDGAAAGAIDLDSGGNLLSDGRLSAGTDLLAAAALDLDINDAQAGGSLNVVADGDVDAGALAAGGPIFVGARADLTVGTADTDGAITLEAEGDATAGTLASGDFIGVQAGGAVAIAGADSARFIAVTAAGSADLGTLTAGQDIDVDASDIALQSATAGRDVALDAGGAIAADLVEAGDDIGATAGGSLTVGEATAGGGIELVSGGDLRLDDGNAADLIRLVADGGISSAGTLTAAELDVQVGSDLALNDVVVAGDLALSAPNGAISGDSFAAEGSLDLEASGAVTLATASAVDDLGIDGGSIDLGAAAAGGDIALQSGGAIAVAAADAGGGFTAAAGGDGAFGNVAADSATVDLAGTASFNGTVAAAAIAIASVDIDIAATGQLGGAGTQSVVLAPVAGGTAVLLGGAADGPGFSLTDAEAGRIVTDLLRLEAPAAAGGPDLLVRDITLDAARVGRLELAAGGIVQVEGALRLGGAGAANQVEIAAGQRLQILTPTGSIRLLDASGLPAGTLTIRSNAIWSASAVLIGRLAADPDFAGRDVLLRTNTGPFAPRGHVEAGSIALFAGDSLFVQNSGRPTDLAGFTVTGTLTITPTGAAPLDVYAFGRSIDPAGGFVTNTEFFNEARYQPGTAGYPDTAQFNLCFINSGICNAPDPLLPDGSDPTRGPFDVPGPAEIRDDLIDASFSADPLVDEPVTSGADPILWECDEDDEDGCPPEQRDD